MTGFWRIAVIVLVLANGATLVLHTLQPESQPLPEAPPPDPEVPEAELVADAYRRATASGPRCFTIGPLATLVQQSRAEDRLRPFANQLRLRTTQADRDRGWWVFVSAPSRSAAIALARRLAERDVEDYFVVADADLPDAVSLGLFEDLDNARRRLSSIRRLGFDAQLSIRREEIPQFWIDYQIDPGTRSPWRFILRASPGARNFEIPCF
ncbi:MAG TPA: hypothetical protein VKO85_07555 [Wenzhouxiangellaceae bacterium]|nr:hypothetical protein [Wenzhouxiangellaceae bacterium]